MTKKVISLVSIVLLIAMAAPVFADGSDWKFSAGSFLENENNLTDNISNQQILGLEFKAQYKDVYVKIAEESRGGGEQLRQKAMLGTGFNFGALAFSPEYEFRTTSKMDDMFGDSADYENRFKLNFGLNLGDHRPYLNTMPTLKIKGDVNTYYHEIELGYRYMISGNQNFALAVYNELGEKDGFDEFDNELQARLYYSYTFENGINVSPFARIGLYRNKAGIEVNERRDRVGAKLSYTAPNGLSPFAEAWWQGVEEADYTNYMMAKIGMTYSW